jgi:uncharacterized membrane protein YgdD (TMEM256/DUF423 family)
VRNWLVIGALLAGLAVGLGAFGAHGLKDRIPETRLATFETGVKYHFYHALALFLVGLLGYQLPALKLQLTGILFLLGILLFSGSLYALSWTGKSWWGAVTPFGGISFLSGWVALAYSVWRWAR